MLKFCLSLSSEDLTPIVYEEILDRVAKAITRSTGIAGLWDTNTGNPQRKFWPLHAKYKFAVFIYGGSFDVYNTFGSWIEGRLFLKIAYTIEQEFDGIAYVTRCRVNDNLGNDWELEDLSTDGMSEVFGMTEEEYVDMWVRDVGPIL